MAQMLRAPEVMLDDESCVKLTEAIVQCADAWGFDPFTDPRITTSFALAVTAGAIYWPRMQAIRYRKINESQADPNANLN